jgi:hypothetical protein
MRAAEGSDLMGAEVEARLTALTRTARERGERVRAPLLILGTSERVGSNWVSDTLRPALGQHNEPFRQQLGPDHPWSAVNPRFDDTPPAVGGLGRHWMVTFAVAKYGPHRQVVKETNLFFALPALLSLLPRAPVLVLSRCPLGVASSFSRRDLFRRWAYRSRYQQMLAMTQSGADRMRDLAALVPDDDPPDLVALVRLQVLNTVLIASALAGRRPAHVAYETAVTRPADALATLMSALPELGDLARAHGLGLAREPGPRPSGIDDTFATTNAKAALTAAVSPADAAVISAAKTASLAVASALLPAPLVAIARSWLSGDHLYCLEPQHATRPKQGPAPEATVGTYRCFLRRGVLEVRNLLVSNSEYARFLSALTEAGMPNGHGGTWLLVCEMPHERGGRLHRDASTGQWTVSPGYEDYPAYWVTWIGAAAFAAWSGTRLPTRTELAVLTADAAAGRNAGYREGDASPVTEPGTSPSGIHHLLGNLQLWCGDGPDADTGSGGPVTRWLYGIAWNTPATREAAEQPRSRHLLGCSRGVGVRLVRDGQRQVGTAELASRLGQWLSALDDRSRPVAEIDQQVIRLLDSSQADAGLGAHVGAGTGESVRG